MAHQASLSPPLPSSVSLSLIYKINSRELSVERWRVSLPTLRPFEARRRHRGARIIMHYIRVSCIMHNCFATCKVNVDFLQKSSTIYYSKSLLSPRWNKIYAPAVSLKIGYPYISNLQDTWSSSAYIISYTTALGKLAAYSHIIKQLAPCWQGGRESTSTPAHLTPWRADKDDALYGTCTYTHTHMWERDRSIRA